MKKLSFLVAAAAALVLASCGGKKADANAEAKDSVSFEQSQIQEKVMVELDSIADVYNNLKPVVGIFEDGKIQLSDDAKKAKPTYLYDTKNISSLSTLSQKYRALAVLTVDAKVAALYDMDVDAYNSACAKLVTDINDPAFQVKKEEGITADRLKAFYDAEKSNGRLNYFWEVAAGAIIENLYIASQNIDKYLPAFDNETASNFTYHVALLKLAVDDLGEYDANIKQISELLAPLNELNAINVEQFKEQLAKMKPQIETARQELLK